MHFFLHVALIVTLTILSTQQAELRRGETSTSESTATLQSGGGSAAERYVVSKAQINSGQLQEQQPVEHSSASPAASSTLPLPSSGRPRLKDSSLPPPQFIGKQRPPIELGAALDEVKVSPEQLLRVCQPVLVRQL